MKIGINASFAKKENTGIGQVTLNFLKKLSELKVQSSKSKVEFVLYLEEELPKGILRLPKNFSKSVFLPFWKRDDLIRKILWEKYYLPRRAKKDGCDVFLSLYQCPTIMPKNIKHLMLVHDIVPKLFPGYLSNSRKRKYWELTEKGLHSSDKIATISSRSEKDLINHLGIEAKKISVNYIDCDDIYKEEVSDAKKGKILKKYKLKPGYIYTGGGLEVRKNAEGTIRAYKYLLETNKNLHFIKELPKLVISGKLLPQLAPMVTDVKKLVKELDLTPHVQILDFVPQKDLPAIYREAMMFVYPSHYEGFGLPVLEAMHSGTAVITSKKSSLPEVGGDSVLYCDPEDFRDIAMVMKNVLLNHDLRTELQRKGKERAQRFSWEHFTKKILNEIKNL